MERRTILLGTLIGSGIRIGARPFTEANHADRNFREDALHRLQRAAEFLPTSHFTRPGDMLYQAGIVSQLALTASLIDAGWSDNDCRQRIGLNVAKALFFARAAGLQFQSDKLDELLPLLSPYGRWRLSRSAEAAGIGTIGAGEIAATISDLLDAVHSRLAGGQVE